MANFDNPKETSIKVRAAKTNWCHVSRKLFMHVAIVITVHESFHELFICWKIGLAGKTHVISNHFSFIHENERTFECDHLNDQLPNSTAIVEREQIFLYIRPIMQHMHFNKESAQICRTICLLSPSDAADDRIRV